MVTINSNLFGYALFIACEYAVNAEWHTKNGEPDFYKDKSTEELIAWLTPQGVINEMENQTDKVLLDLIDYFCHLDPDYKQPSSNTAVVETMVKKLVSLVDNGDLWCLSASNMEVWNHRDVGDDEPGVLVDQNFFLKLIEMAQNTKPEELLVWDHGPFQVIAGCKVAAQADL